MTPETDASMAHRWNRRHCVTPEVTFGTTLDPEAELLEAIGGLTDTLPDALPVCRIATSAGTP